MRPGTTEARPPPSGRRVLIRSVLPAPRCRAASHHRSECSGGSPERSGAGGEGSASDEPHRGARRSERRTSPPSLRRQRDDVAGVDGVVGAVAPAVRPPRWRRRWCRTSRRCRPGSRRHHGVGGLPAVPGAVAATSPPETATVVVPPPGSRGGRRAAGGDLDLVAGEQRTVDARRPTRRRRRSPACSRPTRWSSRRGSRRPAPRTSARRAAGCRRSSWWSRPTGGIVAKFVGPSGASVVAGDALFVTAAPGQETDRGDAGDHAGEQRRVRGCRMAPQ